MAAGSDCSHGCMGTLGQCLQVQDALGNAFLLLQETGNSLQETFNSQNRHLSAF